MTLSVTAGEDSRPIDVRVPAAGTLRSPPAPHRVVAEELPGPRAVFVHTNWSFRAPRPAR